MSAPSEVRRPLPDGRELRAVRWVQQLVVVTIHGAGGECISGPFCIRENEIGALQSALAALAMEDRAA